MASGVYSINLNYVNEPLIRKDIPQFVSYAVQKGIPEVMFNTNGVLLKPDMSEALIDAGLTKLSVSLDASTEETCAKIRVGSDFGKVMENIFNEKYEEVNGYPQLGFGLFGGVELKF